MSDTLRSGLIRLAFANPSLREALLPLIEKEAAAKISPKGKHKSGDVWRTEQGKFRAISPSGVAKSFDSPDEAKTHAGKGGGKSEDKSEKSEGGGKAKSEKKAPTFKKNYRPKMESVMTKHSLTDDDAAEVIKFSIDRPKKGKEQSPAELMRRFMENAKPETKERMKGMNPAEFMKMLRAVLDDEDGGGGKTASLRSGLIRLAYANPSLRPTLLPLIEKHAGEMDAELEEDADPTSHDQNLPEHYYFNKGAAKGESVEAILKQFASPKSKDQNKPESYYGLAPKGKQAAVNPQGAVQAALLAYFKDMPVGTTEELGDVHRHPSFRLMEFGRLMSAAKALAKKGVFKWDGSAVTKIASLNTSRAAAKEKNDYSPSTFESIDLRDDLVKALKKKGLEVEEGSTDNTLYIDGEKVAIHGSHLEGEYVKEWIRKPSRKEWLDEAVKLLGKKASVKTAGGSGAANAAFLRQSPLKDKVLRAVAKHYGVSVSEIEDELTDPDAEALYEYIGNDRALQMQVYREFSAFSKHKQAAAKAPAKLKGKKLDEAISKAYYKHGNNVQVDIMNIGKIYAAGKSAYEGAGSLEEADQALDEAMKAAIAKYRLN
jgi:hypothetical protein